MAGDIDDFDAEFARLTGDDNGDTEGGAGGNAGGTGPGPGDDASGATGGTGDPVDGEGAAGKKDDGATSTTEADDAAAAAAAAEAAKAKPAVTPTAPAATETTTETTTETQPDDDKLLQEALKKLVAPTLTAEQQATVDALRESNPEVFSVIETLRNHDRQGMEVQFAQALALLGHNVNKALQPLAKSAEDIAYDRHMSALRGAHSDYDAVVDKIPDWIKTQPKLVQKALQDVYNGGTTEQMLELVTQFKEATGQSGKPKVQNGQSEAPSGQQPAKPSAADIEALKPVVSQGIRPVASGGKDPNNFDDAFDEFVAADTAAQGRKP